MLPDRSPVASKHCFSTLEVFYRGRIASMQESSQLPSSKDSSIILVKSMLATPEDSWLTASKYEQSVTFPVAEFYSVANALLRCPNLLSTHLFRADILSDSTSGLETLEQKERKHHGTPSGNLASLPIDDVQAPLEALPLPGWRLERKLVRRLIPRNPQLDSSLVQTCHFYTNTGSHDEKHHLLAFLPHVISADKFPFYHPPVRSFAYLYSECANRDARNSLSIHVLPFDVRKFSSLPTRYARMFESSLSTFSRLGHFSPDNRNPDSRIPRDNLLPQHIVQNTYTQLKQKYASNLIENWVEKTEPSKHVFEDLSIAAFLIELWRQMYSEETSLVGTRIPDGRFPGFVDVACGNGVLVFVLIEEGYRGWGFDARPRKTWSMFPKHVQEALHNTVCIPRPFLERGPTADSVVQIHDGIFAKGTFIISNHADELTPWTPILAALSDPENPLPFLAIPCCSHALDGTRHRYNSAKATASRPDEDEVIEVKQPQFGDLRAMRQAKQQQNSPSASAYASLTQYVADLAAELGYQLDRTLMRIPSTRNIGLIGRHLRGLTRNENEHGSQHVLDIVERECGRKGGIDLAARTWIGRSTNLHMGKGHGLDPA